jgi:small subunit ribosomal protein S2
MATTKKTVEKPKKEEKKEEELLVPIETYLKAGIHIGSQYKTGDMKPYIYKVRQDGLHVLDIQTVDTRLKLGSEFLSNYDPSKVLVVAGRVYARKPAREFAANIGAMLSVKRFVPGTLTNPENPNFVEPEIILVSDPGVDKQAINEAQKTRIPVAALCDTNNLLENIDLCIPLNNKGKKALALAYWLLTREVQLKKGIIKKKSDFKPTLEDFEFSGA